MKYSLTMMTESKAAFLIRKVSDKQALTEQSLELPAKQSEIEWEPVFGLPSP